MVSTAVFITAVWLFLYMKVHIVQKHDGFGKFARFGFKNQTYIDWDIARRNPEFVREWNMKIPKYQAVFIFGVIQFVATWFAAIISSI